MSTPKQGNEIADTVRRSLEKYFRDLDGEKPRSVYDMVIRNVERPLLEVVLDRGQPDHRRTDAGHQPQHAAQEDADAEDQAVALH